MVDFEVVGAQVPKLQASGEYHVWRLPDGVVWAEFFRDPLGYWVRFPELVHFLVLSSGKKVFAYPLPGVSQETTEHLYLNQVLPLALSRQHKLVLHGAAVQIDDGCVGFLARSGHGKSTLAASFAVSGYPFLTDDGLVVTSCEEGFLAQPSHPSVRLWSDSSAALIPTTVPVAPSLDYTSKFRLIAGVSLPHCSVPLRLKAVYFLGDGKVDSIIINRVRGQQAVVELLKNCFLLDVEEHEMLTLHFGQLTAVVKQNMCFLLDYPRRYELLADVRQAIINHSDALSNGLI